MKAAMQAARDSFRVFWREVSWEGRRIVPALDLAAVKAAFSDEQRKAERPDHAMSVEHLWMTEVQFDGDIVTGCLINQPNWLHDVKEGDVVHVPLTHITDWLYAVRGVAYGGHTIQHMRKDMSVSERKHHDGMWGLDFGDPDVVRLMPAPHVENVGFFGRLFGKKPPPPPPVDVEAEHPMSENMGDSLREALQKNPEWVTDADDDGWTMLHHQALAGSLASVDVLLDLGADPQRRTKSGLTASDLAQKLRWTRVVKRLERETSTP